MKQRYSESGLIETWRNFAAQHLDTFDRDLRIVEPCDENVFTEYRATTVAGAICQLRYSLYCIASSPWLEMAALGFCDVAYVTARLAGDDAPTEALWTSILSLEAMEAAR